jgi:biotin transporter BioY
VRRQRLGIWIILAMVAFAALGAFLGSHLGDGHAGMVILIGATLGVLGSFLPGSVVWIRDRTRRPAGPGPRQGAA